ncbi:hypothetical protein OEZ71_16345 [Defluviimonas sp. WL0050]|uniref:Paraquat-inducible protein A n=1 Tax=Albidovulum litorale TaxID=2984134 RepID=A0ABT2ZRU3_9RHOB|nr:hypothetical protein [Defluviimonas sp. WL0050]MCV2873868.1 hypothetical protein [Defluviimonas sp. WL0050]
MTDEAFRAAAITAALLFVAMVAASPMECGGVWAVCSFDAPHLPYEAGTARSYLAALSEGALWRYLWIVQALDLIFPALLCITFREAFEHWAPERLARRLTKVAVFAAGIDYLENALIRVMLKNPAGFADVVATATSFLTLAKWLLLAVLFGALARLWLGQRRTPR